MIGTSLGPYTILEPLGAGGMGEVYLAEDTRLGRKVAIKVLPDEFAADPQRLARFEQEARAAAALNHPHIAVVHDVGAEGDTHFIVQEYLRGQSLRQRLDIGPLPLGESLELAIEVAEALRAAHGATIVHRDLKPDNIFVTDETHAKVLDFGLAKLIEAQASDIDQESDSPTILATAAGQMLGTAGYMAPEQVSAQSVDHRTDFFAFGCVLYEMATGKRAFAGKDLIETLYRIGNEEPEPPGVVNEALPFDLDRIIRKCIAKVPRSRYQSAGDLVVDLRSLASQVASGTVLTVGAATAATTEGRGRSSGETPTEVAGARSWRPAALAAAIGVTGFILGVLTMTFTGDEPNEPPTVRRFELGLPAGFALDRGLTFSPDGRTLVFAATDPDGTAGLFRRPLGEFAPMFIAGSEGGSNPRFAPDGESLVFSAGDGLFRIPANGGSRVEVARGSPDMSASWGPDGAIYYADRGSIYRINGVGLEATSILVAGQTTTYENPVALDAEGSLLVEIVTAGGSNTGATVLDDSSGMMVAERRSIGWFDAGSETVTEIIADASSPDFLAPGFITYERNGLLVGEPFDGNAPETSGEPFPLLPAIAGGAAQVAVAADGSIAYVPLQSDAVRSLLLLARNGGTEPLPGTGQADIIHPRLSPDGTRVAASITPADLGSRRIGIYRIGRDTRFLSLGLADGSFDAQRPVWDPTSPRLFFAAMTETNGFEIYRVAADPGGLPELVLERPYHQQPADISPDGRYLLFDDWRGSRVEEGIGISHLALDSVGEVIPFVADTGIADQATFHPDGDRVAFRWDRDLTGEAEVYVARFPQPDRLVAVSIAGGHMPVWAADGNSLYYALESGALMEAPLLPDADLDFGPPRQVVMGGIPFPTRRGTSYDIVVDGRFLASDKGINPPDPRIVIVLNGLAEARRAGSPAGR